MEDINLLVVEDDPNLGSILTEYLNAKGYKSTLCRNGDEGFKEFIKGGYNMCILDVMMPIKDGFTLAKEIRRVNTDVPIIFLTAKSMKEDTIQGFSVGADDYVKKPFSMEELLMRIQAVLRRTQQNPKNQQREEYEIGMFHFNKQTQILKGGKEERKLTSKETDLLELLAINLNDVLDRTYALKKIWGDDSYFNSRSMDVYITKLRKYLKEDERVEIINVHGKGFKLLFNE